MSVYTITAIGSAREVYVVVANSEDEAREKFANGDAGEPVLSEVEGCEIDTIDIAHESA